MYALFRASIQNKYLTIRRFSPHSIYLNMFLRTTECVIHVHSLKCQIIIEQLNYFIYYLTQFVTASMIE